MSKKIIREGEGQGARYFDPLENIFEFWKWLDIKPPKFTNYNVRGQMITFYLPVDEMLAYANLLQQRGYADDHNENMWIHYGYARGGYYFRIGPYNVRLAQHREKMHNQQDVKWLMEKHQDEVKVFKSEIARLNKIIETIKNTLTVS